MKKLIKVNWKMLSSFVLVFCLLLIPFNALADPTFVSANDPDLPDKARGVPKGGALRVFDFELDQVGITTLDLQRIEVFAPDAEITIVSDGGSSRGELPGVAYFRGKVADKQGSIVMFAVPKIGRGAIRGLITGKEGAWLFKGKDNMPGIQTRKVDVENELQDKTFECGVDQLSQSATEAFSEFTEAAAAVAAADLPTNVLYTAHMIVDTDYEYFQRFGFIAEDALEYMGDLFAYASSVYEREINTNLLIIGARLFGTNTDPYVENDCGCGTEGALDELQDTWSGILPDSLCRRRCWW